MAKRGAKTKYKKDFARQAEIACREGGFTDIKLAKLFDVSKATITNWKAEYPEFLASIKKGKDDWDSSEVENSLLKRAMGYKTKEITKEPGLVRDEETGEDKILLTVTREVTKEVAPDTGACVVWLTNRKASRWSRNGDNSDSDDKPQPINVTIQVEDAS